MTRQPSASVSSVTDPRQACVVTEDEVAAMSPDQTDELLVQAARRWVVILTRVGGQAVFVPDPDLVRAAAARRAAHGGPDQADASPLRELDQDVAEAIRDSADR